VFDNSDYIIHHDNQSAMILEKHDKTPALSGQGTLMCAIITSLNV